jgi:uncharacterized damage-inducible protein DinB
MIKILCLSIVLMTVSTATEPTSLTEAERKYLLDFMAQTKERLLKNVKDLTATQLNFKPDSTRWSVAECVEHLALTENSNANRLAEGLKTKADPSNRTKVTMTDEAVLKRYRDRSDKRKTTEALEPNNRLGSFKEAMDAFVTKRDANIEFVKTTQEDLRNRTTSYSFATIDLYQCLLLLTAHSERHIVQLEEVMAHPNFPK